nr:hypothetical protein [Tanacetum cinerariifolium]
PFNQNYMQQPITNPEDITDLITAMNMALALMAKALKLNYSTPTNNNQRISSNPRNGQIAQRGMNMGQDRQMQMVGGNGGNQFRQYAGQNVGNLNGYNAIQNDVRNQVIQNAIQNQRIQNVRNQNGQIVVPGNANQNQIGNEEYDLIAGAADMDEIEEVNANCILMANLQQATTTKLITKVVTAASDTITAIDTLILAATITAAAAPILTTAPSAARKRKGVVIRDLKETATPSIIIHTEPKSKDKGKGIMVHKPKPLKNKTQIEQDEAYARKLEVELNKNIDWDEVIEQVQRNKKEGNVVMRYQALKRKPQTEAHVRKNMMIYLRNIAGFKMDYFKGITYDDIRPIFEKKINSNVAFLEKTKEQMEKEDNRAFKRKLSLLKTRLDLKVLWKLVKERFVFAKPKTFSDDFLLTTPGAMFEKPVVQAQI